jgi:hypothetical protein
VGKLQQERDQAKANAEKAAEGLAKEGPGQRSPLCRQTLRLFLDGRIDDAIKLLDEDELRRTAQEEKGKSPMPSRAMCKRCSRSTQVSFAPPSEPDGQILGSGSPVGGYFPEDWPRQLLIFQVRLLAAFPITESVNRFWTTDEGSRTCFCSSPN